MRLLLLRNRPEGPKVRLAGKEFSYISKVLRLREGDQITARDPQSSFWLLTIEAIEASSITASAQPIDKPIETTDALPKASIQELWLFQGVTKEKKLEQIVRQATEIGVSRIIPFHSAFSTRETVRSSRLVSMVEQAIQQSGSSVPTVLEEPIDIRSIPSLWNSRGPLIFFHQAPSSTIALEDAIGPGPAAVIIGSEGGLSDQECQDLVEQGAIQAYLKTNILRAETAAVYALGVVQSLQAGR
ncbi:MAG: RsmE family RNA methyltransferase [Sphaerochaetaceae bacterium]|jgi:16S rRNA (uracil1498-N3)-methyltransferase